MTTFNQIKSYLIEHRGDRWLWRYFSWLYFSGQAHAGRESRKHACPVADLNKTASVMVRYCGTYERFLAVVESAAKMYKSAS